MAGRVTVEVGATLGFEALAKSGLVVWISPELGDEG
jgi:hypothetical protein